MLLTGEEAAKFITPAMPYTREGISCGIQSYGYDARLGHSFKVLTTPKVDPKGTIHYVEINAEGPFTVSPYSVVLGHTIEHFTMPDDVLGLCVGKSTYARCGLIINVTPLGPGWRGQVTLELCNGTRHGIRVYPGEGIAQCVFFRGPATQPYRGRYQDQLGVVLPR